MSGGGGGWESFIVHVRACVPASKGKILHIPPCTTARPGRVTSRQGLSNAGTFASAAPAALPTSHPALGRLKCRPHAPMTDHSARATWTACPALVGAQAFKLGANGGIGAAVRLAPWLTPFRSSSHVQVVIQTHPTNAWTLNHTNMALAFFSSVRRHWRRTVRTRWPRRAC
eukprot:scaffold8283_cov90-Isochrysis_galbana.AAC.2